MKNLIYILALAIATPAFAYEVPKDAVIKVYDKNGKEIGSMSRSQYKVVKIDDSPKPKMYTAEVVEQHVAVGYEKGVQDERAAEKSKIKYSAIVSGGPGKDGVEYQHSGTDHIVRQKDAAVGMAQLCASKNRLGLCAHATTNQFYGLGIKLDLN